VQNNLQVTGSQSVNQSVNQSYLY